MLNNIYNSVVWLDWTGYISYACTDCVQEREL